MTHKLKSRSLAIQKPALKAAPGLMVGFVLLTAIVLVLPRTAAGQVFSSTPYVAAPDPAVEELRTRLNSLEGDLKAAVDRSEKLAFDLSQARRTAEDADAGRKRLEAEVSALKTRIEMLEQAAGVVSEETTAEPTSLPVADGANGAISLVGPSSGNAAGLASATPSLPEDQEELLKEAKNLLLGGNYAAAQQAATAYLDKYPKSKDSHEAQYMLGETLLYQDNYSEAAAAYGKLLKDHPSSPNGPNALVKLARSMRLMEKPTEACRTLDLMSRQFPKASETAKQLAAAERQRAKCK